MEITSSQAEQLLRLARRTIEAQLGQSAPLQEPPEPPSDPVYRQEVATFVTLKIGGQLRGCVGSLEVSGSLWDNVRSNAIQAAFHDSRFRPLSADELREVNIDISLLTRPQPLQYRDGDDLVAQLRPGVDGVILRHGRAGATFLPQVWGQLPTAELFLSHLCRKAGLPEHCWREDQPWIELYQVQHFEEKTL